MTNPKNADRRITHKVVERRVGDLYTDPNVQRGLRPGRVADIAADFSPNALGVLTTSYRGPGQIHIVDGQHRHEAAAKVEYKGPLQTMEYHGLTIPEEAALFRQLNNTQKVSAIDRFLVSVVEQNTDSVRLAKYLADHGWTLGGYAAEGKLSAIGALERIYGRSPEAADGTLAVLTSAWGHRPSAVQGSLMEGLGLMLARYGRSVDLDDFARRLGSYAGGPDALLGYARGQKAARTGNLCTHVASIVTDIYNERRRSTKLPPWS